MTELRRSEHPPLKPKPGLSGPPVELCMKRDRDPSDLLPCFRTKLSMICAKERGRGYVEEQAHGSADDRGTEASRGGAESGGCGARSGRVQTHALRLEGEVRWHGREPGAGGEAVA